jgi:hypothetical protein
VNNPNSRIPVEKPDIPDLLAFTVGFHARCRLDALKREISALIASKILTTARRKRV